MKKILMFLIISLTFSINITSASVCSSEEKINLNNKAANIKASYEIKEETKQGFEFPITYRYFDISITNVSNEFYIVVKNSDNTYNQTFNYENSNNGLLSIRWDDFSKIHNFTVEVYTSNNTGCANERIKTLYVTTPRYNDYSENYRCDEYSEFYLCKEYVSFGEVSYEKFESELNSYIKKQNKNDDTIVEDKDEDITILDIVNDYKWYIVGGCVVILSITMIILIIKKRKYRELGL